MTLKQVCRNHYNVFVVSWSVVCGNNAAGRSNMARLGGWRDHPRLKGCGCSLYGPLGVVYVRQRLYKFVLVAFVDQEKMKTSSRYASTNCHFIEDEIVSMTS